MNSNRSSGRQRREHVAFEKTNPLGDAMFRGVAMGHGQRRGAEIHRRHPALSCAASPQPRRGCRSRCRCRASSARRHRLRQTQAFTRPRVSLSGRGISTSRLTSNSSEKNSLRPTRYATGQPSSALPDQVAELAAGSLPWRLLEAACRDRCACSPACGPAALRLPDAAIPALLRSDISSSIQQTPDRPGLARSCS